MQFYDVSTFDYKLVREENNGVYIGDNFYTVQDADVSYPISVLVDANEEPVCRIDWHEQEILPYEEEPEGDNEPSDAVIPAPAPLGYGVAVLDQVPHIFNPDQIINYDPARDAGEANFYGYIYQVVNINTEPQIYHAGHHIGYIENNVAHFY